MVSIHIYIVSSSVFLGLECVLLISERNWNLQFFTVFFVFPLPFLLHIYERLNPQKVWTAD